MSKKNFGFVFAILLLIVAVALYFFMVQETLDQPDGLYAQLETSKGKIIISLEFEKTPITVMNFVGLAEGTIENSAKNPEDPYYDGLKFHRVIADFMIQGGDPSGNGSGGPGYRFDDEFHPDLKHDGPGILSMANAGPATNGSQFFITHKATPHLDNRHSVFGKVVEGIDVVNAIVKDDLIQKIKIWRIGEKAKKFKPNNQDFQNVLKKQEEERKNLVNKLLKANETLVKQKWPEAIATESGLKYIILKEGKGEYPKAGDMVETHYSLFLLDGKKVDSSIDKGETFKFPVGMGKVIKGWDEALLTMKKGEKRILIVPHQLGYGARGGGPITPYATLHFEMELVDFKSGK